MEQTIDLKDLYMELKKIERAMVTKDELNRLVETIEIMSSEDTMGQIAASEKDIGEGNVKEIDSVDDLE
tara:strand:+ start:672 stop:878 length:207 start_codon:yes stop_codon:yes gene_type:complete